MNDKFRPGRTQVGRVAIAGATTAVALMAMRALHTRARRWALDGRVVLITGGSRGLGLVLAQQLSAAGARVAVCARNETEITALRARFSSRNFLAVQCDVTEPLQVNRLMDAVLRHFGRLDVLINNAGTITVGPMEEMTDADYERSLQLHFWAAYHTTMAALPHLRARGEGRIVNIASVGGKIAVPHLLPYSVGKFAMVGWSKGLNAELAKDGIQVTTVCPGLMRTGSPRHAEFKGQHRLEYQWFTISDSIPLLSVSAESAARRIIRALRDGRAELVFPASVRLAVVGQAALPGLAAGLFRLANWLLPAPGGIGRASAKGYESETPLTRSPLTFLTRRAEVKNGEL